MTMYSEADRCEPCSHRALLDEGTANALVRVADGCLVARRCPHYDDGWHVWAPETETAGPATGGSVPSSGE
ncbi:MULTISPECIES: hypothetical protein [Actinoalloteichus]|uniref:Uncharacterized protein n=1 Tax=Actinoalloteichus fjordicus TaxID=1612552 RepID=A0AAC9LH81_9PSEU|nr:MULTISPECIES: hypothetical protein [Actinoalloteichus]APU17641.1 hypothetical protein UA74_28200 [Actinoalloteichus fjordicus]APU23717.1 hypothetical protein UA75_28730 [Actinoalloteichus sp. GBA129-24]